MKKRISTSAVGSFICVLLFAACGDDDAVVDAGPSDAGGGVDASRDAGTTDAQPGDMAGLCAVRDVDGDGVDSIGCGGTDCDDDDATRFPGNAEFCDGAGHDEDCNAFTFGATDADGDLAFDINCCNTDTDGIARCGSDCADDDGSVNPTTSEVCNDIDDNCDGNTDEGLRSTLYPDADADGFGAATGSIIGCAGTTGYAMNGMDCNDENVAVYPGATEICNGLDDNCDGVTDTGTLRTVYRDADGDGHGAIGGATMNACVAPAGYSLDNTDCNDANAAVYVGATEVCNGLDDNCSGVTDENLGAPCGVGVGACRTMGARRCDGSCTAVAEPSSATFHTTPAANGSFDWNCDGVVTSENGDLGFGLTEAESAAYCASLSPADCDWACAGGVAVGLVAPGSVTTPYCGAPVWTASCCPAGMGRCVQTSYGPSLNGCR